MRPLLLIILALFISLPASADLETEFRDIRKFMDKEFYDKKNYAKLPDKTGPAILTEAFRLKLLKDPKKMTYYYCALAGDFLFTVRFRNDPDFAAKLRKKLNKKENENPNLKEMLEVNKVVASVILREDPIQLKKMFGKGEMWEYLHNKVFPEVDQKLFK